MSKVKIEMILLYMHFIRILVMYNICIIKVNDV